MIAFFVEGFNNFLELLIDSRMKDDSYIRGCKRNYLNLGLDGGFAQQAVKHQQQEKINIALNNLDHSQLVNSRVN